MDVNIEMYEKIDDKSMEALFCYNKLYKDLTDKYIRDKESLLFEYRYKVKNLTYELENAIIDLNKYDAKEKIIKHENYKKKLLDDFIKTDSELLAKYNLDISQDWIWLKEMKKSLIPSFYTI